MIGEDVARLLQRNNYTIKEYNSKTVRIVVNNRLQEIENLQTQFKNYDCFYDKNANGSSVGVLYIAGVRVILKKNKTCDVLECENVALESLKRQIIDLEKGSKIVLPNGKEIINPTDVKKPHGRIKSDFYIVNDSGDELHISHKNGSKPKDFQQWSGVSEYQISNNSYANKFQQAVNEKYPNGIMPSKSSIMMEIPNDEDGKKLKLMAVYGVDAINPDAKSGKNKVDCLIQGEPVVKSLGEKTYSLSSSVGHIYSYPDIPSGGYEPVFSLVYKGDRSSYDIKGARASIYPRDGRVFKERIE